MTTITRRIITRALTAAAAIAASLSLAATANAAPPVNLKVDDGIRAELLQAGAALKQLPASDFTGLEKGLTYYAYDPDTTTYWAGAHLLPSATSTQAQVSVQDDGSYTLFRKVKGGLWTAFNDGMQESQGCPQNLPQSIITMWQWNPQWCRPLDY